MGAFATCIVARFVRCAGLLLLLELRGILVAGKQIGDAAPHLGRDLVFVVVLVGVLVVDAGVFFLVACVALSVTSAALIGST